MAASRSPEHTGEPPAAGRRRWSLLSHLLALVVAVTAVTLSAGGYLTLEGYDDARQRALSQLRGTVDLAARGIRLDLEEAVARARAAAPGLGSALSAAAGAGESLAQVCQLTFSPGAVFTQGDQHLLDPSGTVSCTSRPAALGTSYAGQSWFAGLATGDPVVGSVARDPVTGDPTAVVAMAVPGPDGQPAGYHLVLLAARPVASTLAGTYGVSADYAFVVTDGRGGTLSSSSAPTSAGRPAPRVGEGETARDADGTERIYSASRVPSVGWRVLGGVSRSAALAPAQGELRRRVIITVTSLIALLLLAVAVHRRLLRPVRDVSRVVTRARAERGVQAPVTGPAELADLAGDLNAMLAARDRAEADLAALARALEDSGRLLVEAREQERQQVGTRLHDGPIQDMILTTWVLDDVAAGLPAEAVAEVRRRLDTAIASSRAIEADLRPPKLADFGLSEALTELVGRRRADSPFEIEVDDQLQGARFPLHTELLVYRSVQEAIQNVRRHARATRVTLILRSEEGNLTAIVADDGVGVDDDFLRRTPATGQYGVASMRDTVTLAGGRYHSASGPEGGTRVRVDVPVPGRGRGD